MARGSALAQFVREGGGVRLVDLDEAGVLRRRAPTDLSDQDLLQLLAQGFRDAQLFPARRQRGSLRRSTRL